MPTRRDADPSQQELMAAYSLELLAEAIADAIYFADGSLPERTVKALNKCYRILKPIVIWYAGEDQRLCYDAPDGKFKPKAPQSK
jgi:hypothetical protein